MSNIISVGIAYNKNCTISEVGDGQIILSKGKAVEIPIVTSNITVKMDIAVMPFLQDVDLILGICRLQFANPLIEWSAPQILLLKKVGIDWLQVIKALIDGSIVRSFIPAEVGICVLRGSWFDQSDTKGRYY